MVVSNLVQEIVQDYRGYNLESFFGFGVQGLMFLAPLISKFASPLNADCSDFLYHICYMLGLIQWYFGRAPYQFSEELMVVGVWHLCLKVRD